MCQEDGVLNEEKLSKSISFFGKQKPQDYRGILHELRKLVRLDMDKRTVYVESAKPLSSTETTRIVSSLTKKHGENLVFSYAINENLIAGLKVRVGSQVYDGTVLSKINRIANSI